MHSNIRGERSLSFGKHPRYLKPSVEGQFDDDCEDQPIAEGPSELNHLDSDSANDESKHSEDSDYEDVNVGGKNDEVEINEIRSDLTAGYTLTYRQIKGDPQLQVPPLN